MWGVQNSKCIMDDLKKIWGWLRPVVLSVVMMAVAGFWNANMDTVAFHFSESVFEGKKDEYYNPAISWQNKWWKDPVTGEIDVDREKYWGSSRWFVKFTDYWHLAKSGMLMFVFLSVVFYRRGKGSRWWEYGIDYILLYLAFTFTFSLFFGVLLLRKKKGKGEVSA